MASGAASILRTHLGQFGRAYKPVCTSVEARTASVVPGFCVEGISFAGPQKRFDIAVTSGLWRYGQRHEFCVVGDVGALGRSPLEVLSLAAYFSATRRPLHCGEALDVGSPWADGSEMTALLVSLPYPLGPAF